MTSQIKVVNKDLDDASIYCNYKVDVDIVNHKKIVQVIFNRLNEMRKDTDVKSS